MTQALTVVTRQVRDPAATLEPHEIRRLLQLPDRRTRKGKRAAALLAVLSYGLRIGEAVTLRLTQVKHDAGGRIELRDVKTLKRKDHRRSLVLDATASQLVKDWIVASGSRLYLFPGRRDHLSVDAGQDVVDRYLRTIRPECSAHNLRHSFCTNVVRETGSIWMASQLVGHSDIRLTARVYAHASLVDARLAADALTAAKARRAPRRH
jgi:integrase